MVADCRRRRGGVRRLRSLSSHTNSGVCVEAHLSSDADEPVEWVYRLAFTVECSGNHRILVQEETVKHNGVTLLNRPDQEDKNDTERLTATALG